MGIDMRKFLKAMTVPKLVSRIEVTPTLRIRLSQYFSKPD